jgi:hypothetical protein
VTGSSWCRLPDVFRGVKGYRAALSRQSTWVHSYLGPALKGHTVACVYCGGPARSYLGPPVESMPHLQDHRGLHVRCDSCHAPTWSSLNALALSLPEGRRFWRRYPRIHALPYRLVEADGALAIVASHQEHGGLARFDVVFARDTLEVIGVHGAPVSERP